MATSRFGGGMLGFKPSVAPPRSSDDARDLLPRLTQETELQKLLADEKMRAEQHRTNYQTLKAEHHRLQDEYMVVQTELKSTIEESKLVQEKYKSLMEQLRGELSQKHREAEDARAQAMNPQKLDLLRLQMTDEVESPFREKYARLEQEIEKYRAEYNKLKYEFSFLKSEYEHEKGENQRIVAEMKLRHEAEVSNLRKERETLIARQQAENSGDSQRVRVLQRENAQMHLKTKGLLTELEEIRAQREHVGLQSENVSRLQYKQLAEHAANIKAMETERESLKLQCSSLQKELSNTNDLQTQLTGRIHDLEKENIQLKNRSEETSHKSRVDITNLKMEMLRERGELERERDRATNQIDDLTAQIDILKHSMDHQSESLVDKEREAVKRVQAAREEEWQKLHTVENDKLELETKLQELDRRKIDEESQRHADREKLEERLQQAADHRQDAEKELLVLKTKLQHQQALLETIDRERTENSDLKNRLHRIESAYNSYVGSERELVDTNAYLKHHLEQHKADNNKLKDQLRILQEDAEKVLLQNRASWADDKMNLQRRIEELDTQMMDMQNKFTTIVTAHRKKKNKYCNLITKMKHKITLYGAKNEELTIERDALKKSVPTTAHLMMKKKLKDLMQRHRDFRSVILTGNMDEVNIGNLSFASATGVPIEMPNLSIVEVDRHQKDLALLKERLDLLDDHQKQQLQELKGFTPAKSPPHHDGFRSRSPPRHDRSPPHLDDIDDLSPIDSPIRDSPSPTDFNEATDANREALHLHQTSSLPGTCSYTCHTWAYT